MRKFVIAVLAMSLSIPGLCFAEKDNPGLTRLDKEDQAERGGPSPDWAAVGKHDRVRAAAVANLLKQGKIRTAQDCFHASDILLHVGTLEYFQLSYAISKIGVELAPNDLKLKEINASAWDRIMMFKERPQWYGTQFVRDAQGNWSNYSFDKDVLTDNERSDLGGLTAQQIDAKLQRLRRDYPAQANGAAGQAGATGPAFLAGGNLKFSPDKETIHTLTKQDPALGLFWLQLSRLGAPEFSGTSSTMMVSFETHNYQEAIDVIDGGANLFAHTPSGYATFMHFFMTSKPGGKLVIDVKFDDTVMPAPELHFNFNKHYQIVALMPQATGDDKTVRFDSVKAITE